MQPPQIRIADRLMASPNVALCKEQDYSRKPEAHAVLLKIRDELHTAQRFIADEPALWFHSADDKKIWSFTEDFPVLRLPYPATWIEFIIPGTVPKDPRFGNADAIGYDEK